MPEQATRSQSTQRVLELCREVAAGRKSAEALDAVLEERESGLRASRAEFSERALAQGDAFCQTLRPYIEAVLAGHDLYGHGLERLAAFRAKDDEADLYAAMNILSHAGDAVLGAMAAYDMAVTAFRGPTASALVNSTLKAVEASREGIIPPSALIPSLDELERSFRKLKTSMTWITLSGRPSAGVEHEMGHVTRTLHQHQEALDELRDFARTGNPASAESGAEKLRESVLALAQSRHALADLSSGEGKTPCMWCAHPNEAGAGHCGRCGRVMRRWMDTDATAASTFAVDEGGDLAFSGERSVMTENLQGLLQATWQVSNSEMSAEDFYSTLDRTEELLSAGEARLSQGSADCSASINARAGIERFRNGLRRLRRYLRDGNVEHLHRGAIEVRGASAELLSAASEAQRQMGVLAQAEAPEA